MSELLYKELRLAAHPNLYVFMLMGMLLLVPSYPFGVVFLFGLLGPYISVFYDRETRDTYFTVLLPIKKADVVKGKCALFAFAQLGQLIISVPFALLRPLLYDSNAVGMEANAAYYGFGLMIYGIFDLIFLTQFYKTAYKAGKAFIVAGIPAVLLIAGMEFLTHIPGMAWICALDAHALITQLPLLVMGAVIYSVALFFACRRAGSNFSRVNL